MTHPPVVQLRFARSELQRCLEGLSEEEAVRRLQPMNCIRWMVMLHRLARGRDR
jgi:hypothetical protein